MIRAELKALIERVDAAVLKMNLTSEDVSSAEVAEAMALYNAMMHTPAATVEEASAKLGAICRFNADGDIPSREVAVVVADLERLALR